MSRRLAGVLAGLLVVAMVGTVTAGIPHPEESFTVMTFVAPAVKAGLATCPAGDGPAYQYMVVTAERSDGTPIQGILSSSFFFDVTGGEVTITCPDSPAETDVNGQINFEIVGDETIIGYSTGAGATGPALSIETQIYTVVLTTNTMSLDCNSFDVDGNDAVGGQDGAYFVVEYGKTNEDMCDFNWDGSVTGQDGAFWVAHYGH